MSVKSSIAWTESTWNPVTGCTICSPGCKHCYAKAFAERFRGVPGHAYEQGFDVRLWENRLEMPKRWRKPRLVFANSMSDFWHEEVPDEFIETIFETISETPRHTYQILTKRPERMLEWALARYGFGEKDDKPTMPSNAWIGVSVELQVYVSRIHLLQQMPTSNRFVSFEPVLGEIVLEQGDMKGIGWAIIGGESGAKARRMMPEWADMLVGACKSYNVPCFFKQWGTFDETGARLKSKYDRQDYRGKILHEYPPEMRVGGAQG